MIEQNNADEQVGQLSQTKETYAVESQQQQEGLACVLVRDLDSGVSSCVDPFTLQPVTELDTPRKGSAWDDYWNEKENNKHRLLKLVNTNQFDELMDVFKHKAKQIDINEYVYLDGWTLLHHAVGKKLYNIVLVLIQNGCDVNKPTQSMKRTPLHIAVLEKQSEIIELLLQSKADPNSIDVDFCTPVHYAADFGYLDIFKILLSCEGVNFGLKNNKKMTVVDCCRDTRMRDMIKQYCEMHQTAFEENQYYSRTMDTDKRPIFHVRNRCDFIEKILYENPRLFDSDTCSTKPSEGTIEKQKYSSSTSTALGSKIKNKEKFQRASMIAKQSLCSFRDSLLINTTQSLENYDIFRKLGSGTFGTVFLIRKKQSSKLFALKRLSKKLLSENKMKKYAYAERQILKTLKHPFILHAHSFFQDASYLYMVMEFCAGGDLQRLVRKRKFQQQRAKKYTCEVILALQELHKYNYLFRDLKVSNVLLDQFGYIRLADFGLAKQSEISHSFLGSVAYLAPQMLVETDNKPHTAAIDWYLLGVFVYEMLVGLPPFYNQNRMQMFEQIKKNKPRIPSNVSPQCKDFLSKTLAKKPNQRLGYNGAFQIKSHTWFKDINWNTVLQKGLQMQIPEINHKELRQRQFIEQEQPISQKVQIYSFKNWDHCEG